MAGLVQSTTPHHGAASMCMHNEFSPSHIKDSFRVGTESAFSPKCNCAVSTGNVKRGGGARGTGGYSLCCKQGLST